MSKNSVPSTRFEADIAREQVRLALRHLPVMQLGSFIVALLLAYSVRTIVPFKNIVAWVLMILLIVIVRIVYYARFNRVRNERFNGDAWKKVYLLTVFVSGISWGLASVLIFPAGNLGLISMFLLMIAGLAAATTVSHSSLRFAPAVWMTPILLAFATRCFIDSGQNEHIIGILSLLCLIALIGLSLNNHATISSSIALRFENLKLLEEVQKSEERFRLLFQRHNAVMLLVDPVNGGIVDANAAAERFYGYPPGQLGRMSIRDINLMPPEDINAALQRAMSGESNNFMFPHRLANGEIRIVEVHSSPIQTGDRVLLFSIIRDVTERRKTEERLRQSEASYRNLFNSMSDAIYLVDESGRLLDVNKGAETMYGYAHEFFVNKTPDDLIAKETSDLAAVAKAIGQAMKGEPQIMDLLGRRADGTSFPQEVRFMPSIYDGRRVVIVVARDVSEQKRAEAEQQRTQKLEAIGVLAGGIAHDFNNLLQGVFSYLTVAKRNIDKRDKALLMLEKSEKALQMSVNLTSQLLTFSKGGKPVMTTIDLGPVIETSTRFALSGSKTDCRFDIGDSLWSVAADEGQMGQVIQNIVLNADQSMSQGGMVDISARNIERAAALSSVVPGPGKWVRITIQDNGVGIPPSNLQRIFEPYFTTKETGSGLGLATSYAIIKNHGGMIEVSSAEGAGSTFIIWLPASGSTVRASDRPQTVAVIQKGRILIMDDDEVVRDSVAEMLDELGQDVEFAADGSSAIEKFCAAKAAGFPFSVVILDATVKGGMGGEETIKKLKAIDPDVVAVVSSGYSENAVVSNYAGHGFKAFLHKPFSYESLQAVLGSVMQGT